MNQSEFYHSGIKGMKWGVRRYQNKDGSLTDAGKKHYRSTGVRSAIARKQNKKVDAGFKKWNVESEKRANAIDLGKKANVSKLAYESNKSDKSLKKDYKQANKEYKKALRGNTTYRKGQIKSEVGKDISRKYLSNAKKVGKRLDADPTNKQLQKEYNTLMSKHDVERAKARMAPQVAANRSRYKANIKRSMTLTVKAAATTAAIAGGVAVYNKFQKNGHKLDAKQVANWAEAGKKIFKGAKRFL